MHYDLAMLKPSKWTALLDVHIICDCKPAFDAFGLGLSGDSDLPKASRILWQTP